MHCFLFVDAIFFWFIVQWSCWKSRCTFASSEITKLYLKIIFFILLRAVLCIDINVSLSRIYSQPSSSRCKFSFCAKCSISISFLLFFFALRCTAADIKVIKTYGSLNHCCVDDMCDTKRICAAHAYTLNAPIQWFLSTEEKKYIRRAQITSKSND